MAIEVFGLGAAYYIRKRATQRVVKWFQDGERWNSESTSLPANSTLLAFDELPADLREEILAFVARAEALGNQVWSSGN